MFGDILIVDDREVVRRGLRSLFPVAPSGISASRQRTDLKESKKLKALWPAVVASEACASGRDLGVTCL